MQTSQSSFELSGVVPSVCDAEAGQDQTVLTPPHPPVVLARKLRSVLTELSSAIRSALDDERATAERSLQRASDLLDEIVDPDAGKSPPTTGGLTLWQVRKVTHHVEANLENTIRNDDLASLVRLTSSHFSRAFRDSVGEPPHEYVMRRRIERAQGLMLSTQASLSEIALNCGLADQSHLTRLFRKLVGESPRAWRRARVTS